MSKRKFLLGFAAGVSIGLTIGALGTISRVINLLDDNEQGNEDDLTYPYGVDVSTFVEPSFCEGDYEVYESEEIDSLDDEESEMDFDLGVSPLENSEESDVLDASAKKKENE